DEVLGVIDDPAVFVAPAPLLQASASAGAAHAQKLAQIRHVPRLGRQRHDDPEAEMELPILFWCQPSAAISHDAAANEVRQKLYVICRGSQSLQRRQASRIAQLGV